MVAVGDQLAFLGRGERLGGQEAVQRGLWLVVETLAAAGLVLAPADRLLGRGEVVEPVVDELPETVQRVAFLAGVIAVVEAVYLRTRWLFLDSIVAWSFFLYGRDRVK